MLRACTSFMNESTGITNVKPNAPWSWGTDDEALAKALEERLKFAEVRKEL